MRHEGWDGVEDRSGGASQDQDSSATSQSFPAWPLQDRTSSSAALLEKKTEEASSAPSHPRATSTLPPLRERHPWNRAGAPPGDLWAPARTKAGPETPKHRAHVSTHSHIHAHIRAPAGAHSDVPRDSRCIYKLNNSPWFAYMDHLCAQAT